MASRPSLRRTHGSSGTQLARSYVPPLPHPSWRTASTGVGDGGAVPLATANDFWSRLGL